MFSYRGFAVSDGKTKDRLDSFMGNNNHINQLLRENVVVHS